MVYICLELLAADAATETRKNLKMGRRWVDCVQSVHFIPDHDDLAQLHNLSLIDFKHTQGHLVFFFLIGIQKEATIPINLYFLLLIRFHKRSYWFFFFANKTDSNSHFLTSHTHTSIVMVLLLLDPGIIFRHHSNPRKKTSLRRLCLSLLFVG